MKIGNYDVSTIETGTYALDGGAMFSIVPKTIWSRKNPADERNRIDLALRCLLIVGEGRNILVDVGIGDKFSKKYSEIYKIDFSQKDFDKEIETNKDKAIERLKKLDKELFDLINSIKDYDKKIIFVDGVSGTSEETLTNVINYMIEHEFYHQGIFTCYGRLKQV